MKESLTKSQRLLVGLTLFSMFFGAGNLIFPPFLGTDAGSHVWIAFAGFAVSAIGFPVLGISAVARAGGVEVMAGRVHPVFASVFTFLIYLSIGPCLAIPRTAVTSFEMAVTPFVGKTTAWMLAAYAVLFFSVALVIAWKPDNLTERLGKMTTPCLLVLILFIVGGCLLHPAGVYGAPAAAYEKGAAAKGFIDGYQTMDTLAALNFGGVIALNIQAMGAKKGNGVVKETIWAGLIAGVILLAVYGGLSHVGAMAGGVFEGNLNGAQVLTDVVQYLFGRWGAVLLAAVFVLACMNTCVSLICCCSNYFSTLVPKIPYHVWAVVFSAASMLISVMGLNQILSISVPVLNAIYPVAIVLILLAFLPERLQLSSVYKICVSVTGAISVISAFDHIHLEIPGISFIIKHLPLYQSGFAWLLPAAASLAAVLIVHGIRRN